MVSVSGIVIIYGSGYILFIVEYFDPYTCENHERTVTLVSLNRPAQIAFWGAIGRL